MCLGMPVSLCLMILVCAAQLEGIALDPDAENGVATIGSVDANNLGFSQTQASQATQVRAILLLSAKAPCTQMQGAHPDFYSKQHDADTCTAPFLIRLLRLRVVSEGSFTAISLHSANPEHRQPHACTVMQAPVPKLTMSQKEELLPKLAEEGWLARVPGQHGIYSLGVCVILQRHPPSHAMCARQLFRSLPLREWDAHCTLHRHEHSPCT